MALEATNRLTIETPEGLSFSLLLAGPLTRFLAWLMDETCIVLLISFVGGALGILGVLSPDLVVALLIWAYFLISVGYGILCEWAWRGQTVGKRLLRIRVMDEQGLKLRFSQVLLRNLFRFLDMLPSFYLVGGAFCLLTPKAQRVGDLVARTVVIRQPEVMEPDLQQLMAGKYNSFRKYPHLCSRLRQHVTPAEAGIVLQALLRRESLLPEERVKVYQEIASYMKGIVEFPEEATEGLSDEQYLRNAADVLYNTATVSAQKGTAVSGNDSPSSQGNGTKKTL